MLKKTISYVDYDGNKRTEDHYFHLSQAEITELELSAEGGIVKLVEKLIQTQNGAAIVEIFKKIIRMSYGEKSSDGRRFDKNDAIFNNFSQTEAYSILFMELATNADAAAVFIDGIKPKVATEPQKI